MSADIGIDLGTASVLVFIKGKGVVLKEPSVVALDRDTKEIKAIGEEARLMLGRTPGNIIAIRPLEKGVVSDYTVTEKMIKYFVQKSLGRRMLKKPRISICVPCQITEVEQKAVEEAAYAAGAREVCLVEEPVAGNDFDEAIARYMRKKQNLLVGDRTAEEIKIKVGTVYPLEEELEIEIRGRNLVTGLPKTVTVTSSETESVLREVADQIVESVIHVLEQTPPELSADILERGIMLTGGGALLRGLDTLMEEKTGIRTMAAEDPMKVVAVGTGQFVEFTGMRRNS